MKKHFSLVAILCMALVSFSACKAHKEYERELEDLYSQIDSLKQLGADTIHGIDTIYVAPQEGEKVSIVNGAILAPFSVAEGKQVYFSMGNLQYNAAQNIWRFAEHQYDTIGAENSNISETYDGWIDLFGWGTSGYHDENDTYNKRYNPYSKGTGEVDESNTYGYGPSVNMTDPNLTGTSANYDWGVYNAISNGGNQANLWRSLTKEEMEYLFTSRENASEFFFKASVNGIPGLILLPDNWKDITWNTYIANAFAYGVIDFTTNKYTLKQWESFESVGAIFLPTTGHRSGGWSGNAGIAGDYWTSTYATASNAYRLHFDENNIYALGAFSRFRGFAVRLVQDVK